MRSSIREGVLGNILGGGLAVGCVCHLPIKDPLTRCCPHGGRCWGRHPGPGTAPNWGPGRGLSCPSPAWLCMASKPWGVVPRSVCGAVWGSRRCRCPVLGVSRSALPRYCLSLRGHSSCALVSVGNRLSRLLLLPASAFGRCRPYARSWGETGDRDRAWWHRRHTLPVPLELLPSPCCSGHCLERATGSSGTQVCGQFVAPRWWDSSGSQVGTVRGCIGWHQGWL